MTGFPPVREIIGQANSSEEIYARFNEWAKSIGYERAGDTVKFSLPSKDAPADERVDWEIRRDGGRHDS